MLLWLQLRLFGHGLCPRRSVDILSLPCALECVVAILEALLTSIGGSVLLSASVQVKEERYNCAPFTKPSIFME